MMIGAMPAETSQPQLNHTPRAIMAAAATNSRLPRSQYAKAFSQRFVRDAEDSPDAAEATELSLLLISFLVFSVQKFELSVGRTI